MTHRTGHTENPTEAPRTATERLHTEAPRPVPEPPHETDGSRTAAPGPDGHQVMNRGPGDTGAPPTAAPTDRPAARPEVTSAGLPLLPAEEQDALTRRMRQAVSDFVESPRHAVEEAEGTFDRIVAELTEALEDRRHVLRSSWRTRDTEARTEELRVALQQYRDVGERLLRI
ncbi:DUF1631 domain-containing protein [Streptomyces sp. NBC_01102]|uniref:hypothetical protein n=1 Tax=unclassified Streptomyces TaxID=2593676 RepID=UPI00386EFA6E|nr:DUF1631 domain-containing protein [Streptomyces sp. NBC_01102]